ncbi:hypothetical protein CROQUDRAFT_23290, partial [Cronartium quercuum f. sp. fusiforme G11]
GLEPLCPPGASSNYHDWEFAICAVVMGAEYLSVPLGKREEMVSQAVWTCQNNLLCSLLMHYCHIKNYVFLCPHKGNAAKMWQALKVGHQDQSMGAKMLLLQRIITSRPVDRQVKPHL